VRARVVDLAAGGLRPKDVETLLDGAHAAARGWIQGRGKIAARAQHDARAARGDLVERQKRQADVHGVHLERAHRDRAQLDPPGCGRRDGEPHEMILRPGSSG
jgi:hypothetical protein